MGGRRGINMPQVQFSEIIAAVERGQPSVGDIAVAKKRENENNSVKRPRLVGKTPK